MVLNRQMLKKRLLSIGIVVFFIATFCGSLFYNFVWIDYDPKEYPLQTAEAILQAMAIQTFEPEVTPEIWQMSEFECKALLQALMTQNKNQYTLIVDRVFGDNGTPVPGTGSDEVLLHVIFPDHSRVEMYFYNIFFINCKKIDDAK
jgi:hypothetical protein